MRNYSKTNGTCVMSEAYGVNQDTNKTLRQLGRTYAAAKDDMPAAAGYWEARGWNTNDFLDLYLFEAAWLDHTWAYDTLMGVWGYYRPNWITQCRAHIIAPDGWYLLNFGCITGLGRYSGTNSNVWSNGTASTPGTCLEVNHSTWMSKYMPDRACMPSSAWASDFATVGGIAYQEGLIVENFRLSGGMSGRPKDPAFKGYGLTASNPGECSAIRNVMSVDHNDSGFAMISGTPGLIDTCSAFGNKSEGFLMLGNNGLANTTMIVPSGDENPALIRFKPLPGSVCGGTYTIIGLKSESRDVMQQPIVVEGSIGQLNLIVNGMTCDHRSLACPELISIKGTGPWQVEVHGLQYGNNVQSLLYDQQSGKRLTGGQPFRGNTFGLNSDDGLYLASRKSMAWGGSAGTAPTIDSFTATPSSLTAAGSTLLSWQTSNATSVTITGVTGTLPVDGTFTVQVSATTTFQLTATGPGGTTQGSVTVSVGSSGVNLDRTGWTAKATSTDGTNVAQNAINGNASDFWMSNASMTTNGPAITIDMKAPKNFKSLTFNPNSGYPNSWPRSFSVETSTDGVNWTNKGLFQGALNCSATLGATTAQHVRVTCKTANGNWFNIADLNLQA